MYSEALQNLKEKYIGLNLESIQTLHFVQNKIKNAEEKDLSAFLICTT